MWIQPTFFVSVTGDDNASGLDAANAIRTTDELTRRLMSGTFNQNVTVTFGPGTFGDLVLAIETPFVVTLLGSVTDDAPEPLSMVTIQNMATKTRGLVQVPAGSFTLFQRLKVTSGVAAGAYAFVTGVLGTGILNTDRFRKYNPDVTGLISTALVLVNPAIGDLVVGETLNTSIGRCDIEVRGGGRLAIQDFRVITPPGNNPSHHCESDFTDAISGVLFKGCEFSSANGFFSFIEGNVAFAVCKFAGSIPLFEGIYSAFYGCLAANARLTFGFNTFATFESTASFIGTGAAVLANQGSHIQFNGDANTGDCSWFDAASGNALEVRFGSFVAVRASAQLWGAGTYANTLIVQSCAWLTYFAARPPAIAGGAHDFIVGGTTGFYSMLPFTAPNNAGIAIGTV